MNRVLIRWGMLFALLAAACLASLFCGVRLISPVEGIAALLNYDPGNPAHITFLSIRIPRTLAAIVCGAALGMAGTVMQVMTRNPLADPGILGVNAGAAFAIAIGALLLGTVDATLLSILAFPGAAVAALLVFALDGGLQGRSSPIRVTLAGAALSALLTSLVVGISIMRGQTLEVVRFWIVGSLADAASRPLVFMTVCALFGAILIMVLATRLEALSLGDALARGLGTRPEYVQGGALLAVTLLTGASVAIAGPIAFLGLMVPPMSRKLMGASLRPGFIASAVLGAVVLLLADTFGRLIVPPTEIRAGIVTALIGGPVFILIARNLRPGQVD